MNVDELRQKNTQELKVLLEKQRKDLQKVTLDLMQRKEKNIKKAKIVRKDVARIHTVINEKRILSVEDKK